MLSDNAQHAVAFVVRCTGAATVAYLGVGAVGLPHPVWATMSALVVSQERLGDTEASLAGRIIGSIVGIIAGVGANAALSPLGAPVWAQIAAAVAAGSIVAHYRPALRVCMWTGPLVLLTGGPSLPIAMVGLYRGSEVILGAAIGALFHWVAERIVARLSAGSGQSPRTSAEP